MAKDSDQLPADTVFARFWDGTGWICQFVLAKHRDHWYTDYKLYVGFVLWAGVWTHWFIKGNHGRFDVKACYVMGLNLMVLHLVQYHNANGIMWVVMLILVQNIFAVYLWWNPRVSKTYIAESIYQDLNGPMLQAGFMFVGQLMMLSIFMHSSFTNASSVYSGELPTGMHAYALWFFTYVAVQMSLIFNRGSNSQLGKVWTCAELHRLITNRRELTFATKSFSGEMVTFQAPKAALITRQVCGYTINNLARDIIAFLVPLVLMCAADPLEFVKDSLAVLFIATIDDMDQKEFTIEGLDMLIPDEDEENLNLTSH